MPCIPLKSDKPGAPDGFVCFNQIYEYDGYLFETQRCIGPYPLRKDLAPRKNTPPGFWDMWERFKVLPDEEKSEHLFKEATDDDSE